LSRNRDVVDENGEWSDRVDNLERDGIELAVVYRQFKPGAMRRKENV
jgi:hypothetical protein